MRKKIKKYLYFISVMVLIVVLSVGIWQILFWFFPDNSVGAFFFSYEIDAVYGKNPRYENDSWIFSPLTAGVFWIHNLTVEEKYVFVEINIKENHCLYSQEFWFFVNSSVRYMNCSILNKGTEVYYTEIDYNVLEFEFNIFSIDMQILLVIHLRNEVKLDGGGMIKAWQ